ncbi:MAG: hypothetical protein FWE32_09650 [Oscillospiraceae bacterium]|nr:hypothetical protein [Oscillospiraceae bacterium]
MQGFIITLFTTSITMSALALLYMALTPLLAKRYSEKSRYYVWLIIVIGLIIPFRPGWGSSFISVDIPGETAMPILQIENGYVENETPFTILLPAENAPLPSALSNISWWQTAAAVWLVGLLIFLAFHAIKHYRFIKTVKRWSEHITDEGQLATLQSLKSEMGISKQICLYHCSSVGSPIMTGFIKPQIFLPKANFSGDELRFVLKHELVHFKRKDLYYKCLVLVATAIHWFNPVLYLMARAVNVHCELSCDAETIRNTDADTRRHYSETIIGVVRYQSKLKTALSTNFYGGKKDMKKRIFAIMDTGKKKTGIVIVCMALVITFASGFVFASNVTDASAGNTENAVAPAPILQSEVIEWRTERFEVYRDFGLIYDPAADHLYFNGELVRYFEDSTTFYFDDSERTMGMAVTHFTHNGTIDVRTVRDLSRLIQNPDGSTDLSDTLLGVEPFSQAEFNARNVDNLPQNTARTPSFGVVGINIEKLFEGVEDFGITFSGNLFSGGTGNIYYNGQLVRVLVDAVSAVYLSSSDSTGNISVAVSRHRNGDITGVHIAHEDDIVQSGVQPRAWDGQGVYNGGYDEHPSTLSQSEAGRRAVDIIQRTGNWRIVEPYLPYISNADIRRVVDIYNSKQTDTRRHIAVSDIVNAEVPTVNSSSQNFTPPTWRSGNIMRTVEDGDQATLAIFEEYGITLSQGNIYFNEQLVRSIVFYTTYENVGFIVYHSFDTSGRLVVYVLLPGTPSSMRGSDIENYIRLDVVELAA